MLALIVAGSVLLYLLGFGYVWPRIYYPRKRACDQRFHSGCWHVEGATSAALTWPIWLVPALAAKIMLPKSEKELRRQERVEKMQRELGL